MVVRHRWLALLAASLVVTSCDSPTVPEQPFAFDPRLPGGLVYHWPVGATISVYVDPAGWEGIDVRRLVASAANEWRDAAHYRDFDLRVVDDPAAADVIIHSSQAPFLVDVNECAYPDGAGSGVTFFCPTESLDGLEILPLLNGGQGRVKMDVRISGPRYVTEENLQPYVSHEIGHVLGIGSHSADVNDLMYAGDLRVSMPTERDARTLRWVLRQPADIRP